MSNYGRKKGARDKQLDEVEELLRATEDEMVLKLSVNSHISSSSSSALDQDLVRRFEALKKPPSVSNKITSVPSGSSQLKKEGKVDGGDDVFARFSALRGGGADGGSSSAGETQVCPAISDGGGVEDEVTKLIQWAMDAARLDPSLSDEEEIQDEDSSDDLEDESSDDPEDESDDDKKKKAITIKKTKKKNGSTK